MSGRRVRRFSRLILLAVMSVGSLSSPVSGFGGDETEPVFSGPQAGEPIVSFKLTGAFGDATGKDIDLVSRAKGAPLVIVFAHERTRPVFGLANTVMRFAATRKDKGLVPAVVFLSADPTETTNWLKNVRANLPQDVELGISPDGREGPGAWGLNRNVAMTVIVARENKVTSNFALVQPSITVDGPKIFKAIVDVTGGGEVPDVSKFSNQGKMALRNGKRTDDTKPVAEEQDPNLRPLIVPLIQKEATVEQVDAAAKKIVEYADKHPKAKQQIADIANRIIDAGKLENYGTPKAQEYLKTWAKDFRVAETKK